VLFNSQAFLFAFLPVVWLVYVTLRRRRLDAWAHPWLLLASVFFYAWWDWRYLGLLAPLVVFNFVVALRLEASRRRAVRHALLVFGVAVNLAVLAYFKYAGFLLDNVRALSGWALPVVAITLPLGISFFVFQKIAYLVDVCRGMPAERRLSRYALFVSFFPQLIAGPIVHYREIKPSFDRKHPSRAAIRRDLAVGLSIFAIGLAKKAIVADSLAPFADAAFEGVAQGQPLDAASAWAGAFCYTFQLYFDFSGYSDMAVGLARMFGIDLPFNFHSPYKAPNVRDFWRRWHVTLSNFLRDYLYIPLGGGRHHAMRTALSLFVTMALGGLWHGANWTFVAWGVYHGVLLAVHRLAQKVWPWRVPRAAAVATTFVLVALGWVTFRAPDIGVAGAYYAAMFRSPLDARALDPALVGWLLVAALIVWTAPSTAEVFRVELRLIPRTLARGEPVERRILWRATRAIGFAAGALLLASALMINRVSPFLYFQF